MSQGDEFSDLWSDPEFGPALDDWRSTLRPIPSRRDAVRTLLRQAMSGAAPAQNVGATPGGDIEELIVAEIRKQAPGQLRQYERQRPEVDNEDSTRQLYVERIERQNQFNAKAWREVISGEWFTQERRGEIAKRFADYIGLEVSNINDEAEQPLVEQRAADEAQAKRQRARERRAANLGD